MKRIFLYSLLLLPGLLLGRPVINPGEALKERAFHATAPSSVWQTLENAKLQARPKPRSALVDLLLRANYRATDNTARMNLLRKLAVQDRNTAMAYQCFADNLNTHDKMVDEKTVQEAVKNKDENQKSMLTHAVDHENQEAVHNLIHGFTPRAPIDPRNPPIADAEEALRALEYARKNSKPRALVAMLPGAKVLTHLFEMMPNASLAEINTYYQALEILKKNNTSKASLYKKVVSNGNIAAVLPQELQGSIHEMLHKANPYDPVRMNPTLEKSIISGDALGLTHALNKECDLLLLDARGMNALELATHHGQAQALKLCVENSRHISEQQLKRLVEITLARLQESQFTTNPNVKESLIGRLEATMKYLEEIPAYTAQMDAELITAAREGHTGRVLKALNHGANPNAKLDNDDNSVICLVLGNRNPAIMKLLLKNGADANTIYRADNVVNFPLLHLAIAMQDEEIFTLLLEHGADIEAKNSIGLNSLALSLSKDLKYMRALLARDANTNIKVRSDQGNELSLLEWAINKNKLEHVKTLLEHGADANYITYEGKPLTWDTLWKENPEYLRLLLKHGANPNAEIKVGRSSVLALLDFAIIGQRPAHARVLREHGAKLTWLGLATEYKHITIPLSIIISAGVAFFTYKQATKFIADLRSFISRPAAH